MHKKCSIYLTVSVRVVSVTVSVRVVSEWKASALCLHVQKLTAVAYRLRLSFHAYTAGK